MLSSENRAILGSALVLSALFFLELWAGFGILEQPLLAFVLFPGLAIVFPQLYLALTDGNDITPRTRVRFAAIVALIFALPYAGRGSWQELLVFALGTGAFLTLLSVEFYAGYQSTQSSPS